MDIVGLFGRSVEDAAMVLDVIYEKNANLNHFANHAVTTKEQNLTSGP
jgi:Asp-tRNA(Asn)/Glu-tRNA(Gln) amidotransferase A subunit family amidase